MNYDQWLKKYLSYSDQNKNFSYLPTKDGWDACKQEVLKILKDNLKPYSNTSFSSDFKIDIIEEIEKL